MLITKGALIKGTYSLLRISGITVNPSPEDITEALQVADDYAAQLKIDGLDIGWFQPLEYGGSDPSDDSGVAIGYAGPFKKLLTVEICQHFGKALTGEILRISQQGMRALENDIVTVADAENPPTLPVGSGNEWGYGSNRFYTCPTTISPLAYIEYNNGIYDLLSQDYTLTVDNMVS